MEPGHFYWITLFKSLSYKDNQLLGEDYFYYVKDNIFINIRQGLEIYNLNLSNIHSTKRIEREEIMTYPPIYEHEPIIKKYLKTLNFKDQLKELLNDV